MFDLFVLSICLNYDFCLFCGFVYVGGFVLLGLIVCRLVVNLICAVFWCFVGIGVYFCCIACGYCVCYLLLFWVACLLFLFWCCLGCLFVFSWVLLVC